MPERSADVDGVPIRYRVTGRGTREIVLIHGHLAHSLWWHAVVPFLESQWRVVLVDLSGHGNSGHRDSYSIGRWAADIAGVLDDLGSTDVVLAGHSLGGSVAVAAAAQNPSRVSSVVLLDTLIAGPTSRRPEIPAQPQGRTAPYPSRDEARTRFRLLPPQPPLPDALLEPVAENSLRRVDGGWTWKFDRAGTLVVDYDFVFDCVTALEIPLLYVYGENSAVVTAAVVADIAEFLAPSTEYVEIAGAHHHFVLDHAERCAALIDAFAGGRRRVGSIRVSP